MSFQNSYSNHSINAPRGDTPRSFLRAIASEPQDKFTHWFNHPYNHIFKGKDDKWLTANYYLLRASIFEKWQKSDELIGLRFGVNTRYGLIDIDYESKYHNEASLREIKGTLEADLGINDTILIRSSFSDGWHLYYFFPESVPAFRLAQATAIAFRKNGLEIEPGQLEIFPNVKGYGREKVISFNGHRLPLQVGSYLLNNDLEPYSNSIDTFLSQADQCALSVDFDLLTEKLETARDRYKELFKGPSSDNVVVSLKWFKHSKNAKKWKNESEKAIETGWTGKSQSNDLLGIIAEYGRVFLGIDDESELAAYIVKTAIAASGYFEYCRHQNEIESWARRWAKCAMLHRFPYGSRKGKFKPLSKGGLNNDEKKVDAMTRISEAMIGLIRLGRLPNRISELRSLLAKLAHCSERTLVKKEYLTLWHPKHRNLDTVTDSEFRSHPDINCVVAGEAEKNLLILPTEGSDRVINQIQSSEINQNNSQGILFLLSSEINFARFSSLKNSEPVDLQAFKTRKDTENRRLQPMLANPVFPRQQTQQTEAMRSPKKEIPPILKKDDRVYHIDRPSYGLTITQIINDELVKCKTDGFSGSESFAICELRLLGNIQLLEQKA